jgi:hypothetical protein
MQNNCHYEKTTDPFEEKNINFRNKYAKLLQLAVLCM